MKLQFKKKGLGAILYTIILYIYYIIAHLQRRKPRYREVK